MALTQQDYFLKPGESIEDYHKRIAGLRGLPEQPSTPQPQPSPSQPSVQQPTQPTGQIPQTPQAPQPIQPSGQQPPVVQAPRFIAGLEPWTQGRYFTPGGGVRTGEGYWYQEMQTGNWYLYDRPGGKILRATDPRGGSISSTTQPQQPPAVSSSRKAGEFIDGVKTDVARAEGELQPQQKTPQQVLQESTAAAQQAARVAGLPAFQPGSIVQNGQIVRNPALTATSQNPATQSMIGNINTLSQSGTISPQIQQGISEINQIDAERKAITSQIRNALNQNRPGEIAPLYSQSQVLEQTSNQKIAEINKAITAAQAEREKSALPGEQEKILQQELLNIRTKQEQLELETLRKQEAAFVGGRPLGIAQGFATKAQREASLARQELMLQERNILGRLGLEQDARKLGFEAKDRTLKDLYSDRDFQLKLDTKIQDREDKLFDRSLKLDKIARDKVADVLELIQGKVDPSKLDSQEEQVIDQYAASIGISSSFLKEALQTDYDKGQLDRRKTEAGIKKEQGLGISGVISGVEKEVGGVSSFVINDAVTNASRGLPKQAVLDSQNQITRLINSGDMPRIKEALVNIATTGSGIDQQNQAIGRLQAIEAMDYIEYLIGEAKNKGVRPGLLAGSLENTANRLGRTIDPELQYIGNQISQTLQVYRRNMTGVAFGPDESKEYGKIFPNITDINDLALSKLNSLRDSMNRNQRVFLESKLGRTNYNEIFKKTDFTSPFQKLDDQKKEQVIDDIITQESPKVGQDSGFFGNFLKFFGL